MNKDSSTDPKWQWRGLWIITQASSNNYRDFGYSYWPILAMTRPLDTHTKLLWQRLGLRILLLTSSGNDRDSGFKYRTLVAMIWTLVTFNDI